MGFIDKIKRFFKSRNVGSEYLKNLKDNCSYLISARLEDLTNEITEDAKELYTYLYKYLEARFRANTLDTSSGKKEGASAIWELIKNTENYPQNSNGRLSGFGLLSDLLLLSTKIPRTSKLYSCNLLKACSHGLVLIIMQACRYEKRSLNAGWYAPGIKDKYLSNWGKQNASKLDDILINEPLKKLDKKLLKVKNVEGINSELKNAYSEIDDARKKMFAPGKVIQDKIKNPLRDQTIKLQFSNGTVSIPKSPFPDLSVPKK